MSETSKYIRETWRDKASISSINIADISENGKEERLLTKSPNDHMGQLVRLGLLKGKMKRIRGLEWVIVAAVRRAGDGVAGGGVGGGSR
jgi:hypothetical protein